MVECLLVYKLSGCGFKSGCSYPIKNSELRKWYKVTHRNHHWQPLYLLPCLLPGLTKGLLPYYYLVWQKEKKCRYKNFLLQHYYNSSWFLNCYLVVSQQTLGHYQGDSLTNYKVTSGFVMSLGPLTQMSTY